MYILNSIHILVSTKWFSSISRSNRTFWLLARRNILNLLDLCGLLYNILLLSTSTWLLINRWNIFWLMIIYILFLDLLVLIRLLLIYRRFMRKFFFFLPITVSKIFIREIFFVFNNTLTIHHPLSYFTMMLARRIPYLVLCNLCLFPIFYYRTWLETLTLICSMSSIW